MARLQLRRPIRGQLTAGDQASRRPADLSSRAAWSADTKGGDAVEPLVWRGSADLAALTDANGLMMLPAGDYELAVGTPVDAIPL